MCDLLVCFKVIELVFETNSIEFEFTIVFFLRNIQIINTKQCLPA